MISNDTCMLFGHHLLLLLLSMHEVCEISRHAHRCIAQKTVEETPQRYRIRFGTLDDLSRVEEGLEEWMQVQFRATMQIRQATATCGNEDCDPILVGSGSTTTEARCTGIGQFR